MLLAHLHPDRPVRGHPRRDDGGHDLVSDLHLWRVGPGHLAAIVAVVTDRPRPPDHYKARLAGLPRLSHVTVEVQPRRRPEGAAAAA